MAPPNDDRVDEPSEESFPASDPPTTSQPGHDPAVTTTSGQPIPTRSPDDADAASDADTSER